MTNIKTASGVGNLEATVLAGTQPPELTAQVLVWKFGGKPGNVITQNNYQTNTGYTLLCQTNGKYLTWAHQDLGINLDFTGDANIKKTHLRLPDNQVREILTGEKVAIGIGGGEAFLYYAHRTIGINLKWSTDPVYEWFILGASGKAGEKIVTGMPYALVNIKVEPNPDYLIYLDRLGANIGWTTSPEVWKTYAKWKDHLDDIRKAIEIAKVVAALLV